MIAIFNTAGVAITPAIRGGVTQCLKHVEANKIPLNQADLRGWNLSRQNFTSQRISAAAFEDARLDESMLLDCTFIDCQFSGAVFTGATLKRCRFEYCRFVNASFDKARIIDTAFFNCILTDAKNYFAQFHTGSTSILALDTSIVIDGLPYQYPDCLRNWRSMAEFHSWTRAEQRNVLETLRHSWRMYELWLRDRGTSSSSQPEALDGSAQTALEP